MRNGGNDQSGWLAIAALSAVCLSCELHPVGTTDRRAPEVDGVSLVVNQENMLSVQVHVAQRFAASGRFEYWTEGGDFASTPPIAIRKDRVLIPVIALKAKTSYAGRVVLASEWGDEARSDVIHFSTGAIPDDIPTISVRHSDDPAPGYVMFGFFKTTISPSYAVVVDNAGSIVWYKRFSGPVSEFSKREPGRFMASVNSSTLSAPFYEFDLLGNILHEYRVGGNRETRPHEFRASGGSYALLGSEYRSLDLSSFGGRQDAVVTGIVIEYHSPRMPPLFWNTFDHMSIADASDNISLSGPTVNPWHGNAIDIDGDGHLLVSFRNSNEVTKINIQTGAIIWRLGGKQSHFTFLLDPLNGFNHQHGIRRLPNGNILLFDNGNLHQPPSSRAVEYALDDHAKTATLVWEYRASPPLFSAALGFAQRSKTGHTLITYGTVPRIIEVDQNGRKTWELAVDTPGNLIYRARRIESLYE
jgi:hypothetical protein